MNHLPGTGGANSKIYRQQQTEDGCGKVDRSTLPTFSQPRLRRCYARFGPGGQFRTIDITTPRLAPQSTLIHPWVVNIRPAMSGKHDPTMGGKHDPTIDKFPQLIL